VATEEAVADRLSPCFFWFAQPRSTRRTPIGGPLLILDGEKDHTVPWAIANADHRLRLAAGRADRARLRKAVRPGQPELAGLDLLAGESPPRYYGEALIPDCLQLRERTLTRIGVLRSSQPFTTTA
jgi:hypothetical protein